MSQTDRLARLKAGPAAYSAMRDRAWHRYASISHADLNVGRQAYRDEIERINQMEREQ